MSLTILPNLDQRSPEWFDQRRGMVTASAVGQLLTPTLRVADNDTSRGLVATLAAERITGHTDPSRMTDDMWRGVLHEPYAIEAYEKHHSPVKACGFMVLEEPMPWDPNELAQPVDEPPRVWKLGYSPDGLVGDDGLIEVKCPRAKGHLRTILSDRVPAQHMAQLQSGLLVSGRKWIDFISFHGGLPLFVKRVYPDPAWHDAITAAVAAFETAATQTISDYLGAVQGLPTTERVPDLDEVELKL